MTPDQWKRLTELLKDPLVRLNTLYRVIDADGNNVPFVLNDIQRQLITDPHSYKVVLKSRQHGISTAVQYYMLDHCLFNSNKRTAIIADTRETAEDLFQHKIKFAYEQLPSWLRIARESKQKSARKLTFSNGSSIRVGTGLRGGTYQILHVSEYGKIAATRPDKALEIKTGALNTVKADQQIFIESTAEGTSGEFYELCEAAQHLRDCGRPLFPLEPKFFFFSWYDDSKNRIYGDLPIDKDISEYLDKLGVPLDKEQKLWYQLKQRQNGSSMLREYPSTPREAFEASSEGTYYRKEMAYLRKHGRIGTFQWDPRLPVYTGWDIGGTNYTAIWFLQFHDGIPTFIDYHQAYGEGTEYYAKYLKSLPYTYERHYWPHDGNHTRMQKGSAESLKEGADELGIRPIKIVTCSKDRNLDIAIHCQPILLTCRFDAAKCAEGIQCLDNYTREWDTRHGRWGEKPMKNGADDGADAFRTLAVGLLSRLDEELHGHKGPSAVYFDQNWNQVHRPAGPGALYGGY